MKLQVLNGIKYYSNNQDLLHREDGPAIIWPSGRKDWFVNGKRHREDGPAIECSYGHNEYFCLGIQIDYLKYIFSRMTNGNRLVS